MTQSKKIKNEPEYLQSREGLFFSRWFLMALVAVLIYGLVTHFDFSLLISLLITLSLLYYTESNLYRVLIKVKTYNIKDKETFEKFMSNNKIMETVEFFSHHDFDISFHGSYSETLFDYIEEKHKNILNHYLTYEIEELYQEFANSLKILNVKMSSYTAPDHKRDGFYTTAFDYSVVADFAMKERLIIENAELHSLASDMGKKYYKFVSRSREILYIDV